MWFLFKIQSLRLNLNVLRCKYKKFISTHFTSTHFNVLGHCLWKVAVFKDVDFFGQALGSVILVNSAAGLKQNLSAVIIFVHKVDCNTALLLPCGYNRLMHMIPVHSFASVSGEEGRVDIDNPLRIFIY